MGNSSLPTADAAKSYGCIFYIFVYLLQIEMKTCHKINDDGMDYRAFGKTANKSPVFQNISLSELIQLQIFHLNKVKIKLNSHIM